MNNNVSIKVILTLIMNIM